MKKLKRVVIKEELVELTGDFKCSLVLNQFIYWSERTKDADYYLMEEYNRASKYSETGGYDDLPFNNGWIYKSSEELSEELMIGASPSTIRRYIKKLVDNNWLEQRTNPKYKWDKTLQYRVNLIKIQNDLNNIGYALEGYELLQKKLDNKKELTFATNDNSNEMVAETNQIYSIDKNNITNNDKEINTNKPKLNKESRAYEFAYKMGMCDEEGNQY